LVLFDWQVRGYAVELQDRLMPDTITIAFTDIVDSTAKNLVFGDKAYAEVLRQHDELIRSIAAPAELKTIGDSFMLRFEDPAEALSKLVEIQRQLRQRPIKIGNDPLRTPSEWRPQREFPSGD
jgi:class 3 adenylate cyclase